MREFRVNNSNYNESQRQIKRDFRKSTKGRAAYKNSNAKRKQRVNRGIEVDMCLLKRIYELCPNRYHVDHIIPLSKKGTHSPNNLQYLPENINLQKADKEYYDVSDYVITWQSILVEPATTIPKGSTPQANGGGSAEHPFQKDDEIVWSLRKLKAVA